MSSHVDQLERLQRLRDSGALTQEEFEAEKARILGGAAAPAGAADADAEEKRSRIWLYVIVGLIGVAVAVAAGLFLGREAAPEREATSADNAQLTANVEESMLNVGAPPAPDVQALPPDEQLKRAFDAAFGKTDSATLTLDSGKEYGSDSFREDVQFTPGAVVPAPFGPVLVSVGEVQDAAHVSAGKIAVHYLRAAGDHYEVVRSFVPAVTSGSFGRVASWSVSRKFSDYPVLYTVGGGTWQGYSCASATLTELTPAGPRELATIPLSYSNGGAVTDASQAVNIEGKVRNIVKDQSFDVVYSGPEPFSDHYVRSGSGYVPEGGKSRMQTC